MAPPTPLRTRCGTKEISVFGGGIVLQLLDPPQDRSYMLRATFFLDKLQGGDQKPPLHFHPYQTEYYEVVDGSLTVDVDGKEEVLTKSSGVRAIKPWSHHCVYPTPGADQNRLDLYLSATDAHRDYQLDYSFFENWFYYQDHVLGPEKSEKDKMDIIQVLSMFDAGDSYITLPWWVPCRRYVAYALGAVLGRYIGGMLGYKPFYPEWTTNWENACQKMKGSVFQKRFARPKTE